MIRAVLKHDPVLASKIWSSYKPTLSEKHGATGTVGKSGETAALDLIEQHIPDVKFAVVKEDALSQMLGIDIVIKFNNNVSKFIDVKTGRSYLYYTKQEGWYITLKPSYLYTTKRYDTLMHLGPKKDVFAMYDIEKMKTYLRDTYSIISDNDDNIIKLYRRNWPSFIQTNI